MRVVIAALALALPLAAEFLRVDATFEDIGCASCIESLEGRLARVRGVEKVEIDPARGVVSIFLEPNNQARLTPLLSRITQDGTKILRIEATAVGTIASAGEGWSFQPSERAEKHSLILKETAPPTSGGLYRVTAEISGYGVGEEPMWKAKSVEPEKR